MLSELAQGKIGLCGNELERGALVMVASLRDEYVVNNCEIEKD